MKAAYYDTQGPAREVLVTGELPTPDPAEGEVRVRIVFSGVNPTDIKARDGFAGPMRFPRVVPHQDGAGVIDAVGPGIDARRIGERVWVFEAQYGRAHGTAAEHVVVPARHAVPLPDHVPMQTGACLGIPALTAHRCLFADGPLLGKRVLVQGGAGAVGTAAILLAKWAGAWVATTVSNADQAEVARSAGADLVIDRKTADVTPALMTATHGMGVERIVEVNATANLDVDVACLADGGVVSAYAVSRPDETLNVPLLKAMIKGVALRFVFTYTTPAEAKARGVVDISACLAAGAYRPVIALITPIERISDAHEAQENGVVGKVLVAVTPEGP